MPQTVVVTGMSMSLRNEYTDSAKGVLLAQVRQRDLVFLPGKAPVKVVNEEHCIRIYACVGEGPADWTLACPGVSRFFFGLGEDGPGD